MRVLNGTAVTVIGRESYLAWIRRHDADVDKRAVSVMRARTDGSAALLPEFGMPEDTQALFREWFRADIGSVVVDAAEDDLDEGEL